MCPCCGPDNMLSGVTATVAVVSRPCTHVYPYLQIHTSTHFIALGTDDSSDN